MFEAKVISCCEKKFTDKETNKQRFYYALYIADESGAVGQVYSNKPYKVGESVKLTIAVNRDSRLAVRVSE